MNIDTTIFLLTKKSPTLVGRTCQSENLVTGGRQMGGAYQHARHEGLRESGRCTRPIWGDGRVDGNWHGLCALCWHNWMAFHGAYRLMSVNPAASHLTRANIELLTFSKLPDIGAHLPWTTFPEQWAA